MLTNHYQYRNEDGTFAPHTAEEHAKQREKRNARRRELYALKHPKKAKKPTKAKSDTSKAKKPTNAAKPAVKKPTKKEIERKHKLSQLKMANDIFEGKYKDSQIQIASGKMHKLTKADNKLFIEDFTNGGTALYEIGNKKEIPIEQYEIVKEKAIKNLEKHKEIEHKKKIAAEKRKATIQAKIVKFVVGNDYQSVSGKGNLEYRVTDRDEDKIRFTNWGKWIITDIVIKNGVETVRFYQRRGTRGWVELRADTLFDHKRLKNYLATSGTKSEPKQVKHGYQYKDMWFVSEEAALGTAMEDRRPFIVLHWVKGEVVTQYVGGEYMNGVCEIHVREFKKNRKTGKPMKTNDVMIYKRV